MGFNECSYFLLPLAPPPEEVMEKYGLKEFKDLKTSTSTIMIYTNLIFDVKAIFSSLELCEIEVPLTKKQGNVDKKKILSPYGTIISVQSTTRIRGVDLRKKKRHWCTVCRPYKVTSSSTGIEKESRVFTITEYLEPEVDERGQTDVRAIKYYCSKCKTTYDPRELKKINHFLNQLTIVLSIGKPPMLNIMMFKDNLKVAGCKDVDDAVEAVLILWQDYLVHNPHLWKLKKGATTPKFQFEPVMRNVDFKMGFPIERNELNYVMNNEEYEKYIFMSQYEPTGQTNVNIKMYSVRPPNFKYDCLVIPFDGNPYFIKISEITYKNPKKKAKGGKYITFIVFSSSEVILSGRYDGNMKDMYEFFVRTVFEHRRQIQEIIHKPDRIEITSSLGGSRTKMREIVQN